jgi:hypothetical protein
MRLPAVANSVEFGLHWDSIATLVPLSWGQGKKLASDTRVEEIPPEC